MFKHNNHTYIEKLFKITIKPKYKKEIKERLYFYIETHLNNSNLNGYDLIKYSSSIINNITEEINDKFLLSNKEELLLFFNPIWFENKEKEKIEMNNIIKYFLYSLNKNTENKNTYFFKIIQTILNKKYKKSFLLKLETKKEIKLSEKEKEEYKKFKKSLLNDIENHYFENASFQTYKDDIKEIFNSLNIRYIFPVNQTEIVFSSRGYFNLIKIDINDKEKIKKYKPEDFKNFISFHLFLYNLEGFKKKMDII